jgi:hypothetical protein
MLVGTSSSTYTLTHHSQHQFLSRCLLDKFCARQGPCTRYVIAIHGLPTTKVCRSSWTLLTKPQQVRRYASEAPQSGGSNAVLYTGIGAAGLTGAYFYLRGGRTPTGQDGNAPPSEEAKKIPAQSGASAKKAFTGGEQGFVSLLLEKSEIVNHNTKKLTFKLPEPDMESGLPVACTFRIRSGHRRTLIEV